VPQSVSAANDFDLNGYHKAIPNPGCPDASRGSNSGLVPVAGGGARHPEQVPEPARFGALSPASPHCAEREPWP